MNAARGRELLPLCVAVGLSAVAFEPILAVQFHSDDYLHLYEIENFGPLRFLAKMHGSHLLVTCNAVFYLLHALFGLNPAPYMGLAYLTHLLNVALLFFVLQRLTGRAWLACTAAILWGTSSLNAGALAWYSVYGQALATALITAVVLDLLRAADGVSLGRGVALRWGLFMIAAATSFGVGLGAAAAMPLVAWLLLPPSPLRRRATGALLVAFAVSALLYLGVERYNVARYGIGTAATVVGLGSLMATLQVFVHLLGIGLASLALGFLFHLREYPSPPVLAAVAAAVALLATALAVSPPRQRRQLVAFVLLAAAAYAPIAAARNAFSPISVDLARQERYHYASPVWLAAALGLAIAVLADGRPRRPAARGLLAAAAVAVLAIGVTTTRRPIQSFDSLHRDVQRLVSEIAVAIDRAPPGQDVFIDNRPFSFSSVVHDFPGLAALFVIYYPVNEVAGRRVFFVEPSEEVRALARDGRRSGALLVAPEAVPR